MKTLRDSQVFWPFSLITGGILNMQVRRTLAVLVLIFACALMVSAQNLQDPVQPVNLIMDSDMAGNSDDVGDHAMM